MILILPLLLFVVIGGLLIYYMAYLIGGIVSLCKELWDREKRGEFFRDFKEMYPLWPLRIVYWIVIPDQFAIDVYVLRSDLRLKRQLGHSNWRRRDG